MPSNVASPPRVAVIGAGPCGLMALKVFLEDGFDAVLYERRDHIGGLWRYSTDNAISVAENTEFNSSKYRSAISDFPMPDDMYEFPTAKQLYQYFQDYCTQMDLWPHIKLGSCVKRMQFFESTGEDHAEGVLPTDSKQATRGAIWGLSISHGGIDSYERFDKVAVATGPWTIPRPLKVPGIEKFSGQVVHSMNFHDPSSYSGNVLVIGLSASAQDVISALQGHASKIYLSHRSGAIPFPRYTPDGSTFDRGPNLTRTIWLSYLFSWLPYQYQKTIDAAVHSLSRAAHPNLPSSLQAIPVPSVATAPPLIAAQLWPHVESGFCELVPGIAQVSSDGTVELAAGETLSNINTIINCTGYDQDVLIKIEPPEAYPYHGDEFRPTYYQNTIPIHPDSNIRNSIALLGHGTVYHPGFVRFEVQAMAVSQIWQQKSTLPSLDEMQKWHKMRLAWRDDTVRRYGAKSTFFTLLLPFTDHVLWLDRTAGCGIRDHFGLIERWTNLCAWKFWWEDRELWKLCLEGIMSPALFRLLETGKRKCWTGASAQIRLDNEKVEMARQKRKQA